MFDSAHNASSACELPITGGNAERGVSMTRVYVRQRTDAPDLKGG